MVREEAQPVPKLAGYSDVSLSVRDREVSERFYVRVFGFEPPVSGRGRRGGRPTP